MGKFKIELLGRASRIQYTREDGKVIVLSADLWGEGGEENYQLKDIKHWEPPYEDEEISMEEKQEILSNISKEMNAGNGEKAKWVINVDLSPESDIVQYNEILDAFRLAYNLRRLRKIDDMSDAYKYNLHGDIPYLFFAYCKLPNEEMAKFKQEISDNKNIQKLLFDFAKWKVNEDFKNLNQKKFNYGLYALEMALVDETKEEVKEILKKYVNAAKEKNLSFDEFMQRNRPLNELIKEVK